MRTVIPVALALLAGVLVGAAVVGPLDDGPASTAPDPDNPPSSYSISGPSCYDGPQNNTGWTHVMANGETWAVTLNATVVHPPGTVVDVNVTRRPTDTYDVAITTGEPSRNRPLPDEDCQLASTVNVGASLAEPKFDVTLDGVLVRAVDQDETTANLYPLPRPLNATATGEQ